VKSVWDSPYDGIVTRYGIVLEVDTAGAAPTAVVGWLVGPSGPIPQSELTAV